jgi:citrate lyase beta subunit
MGGALLREKIVAAASHRLAIVVDGSKLVDRLGTRTPGSRGQLTHISVHLEGLFEIQIARKAGRDLATEATDACEALELGVVGHWCPLLPILGKLGCPIKSMA